jgi:electron transfer flavoprotein beta subunit
LRAHPGCEAEDDEENASGCRPVATQESSGSRAKARTLADGVRVRRAPAKTSRAGAAVDFGPVRIAVCVKQVPEANAPKRIDPQTKRLDRSGDGTVNPFDVNAIEEALRIREGGGGDGEVVLVCVGPSRALEALRRGLAMGADRAVLVSDEQAAGSDLVATTNALAAALAREDPDLVLLGQQSSDGEGAVLWAALADRLRRPLISQAAEVEIVDRKVRAKRQTEFGYDVIEAPLPAVVAVSDAVNEPRYPSLKGIMGAKRKPQETLSASDLGLAGDGLGEPGSRTVVLALDDPPPRSESRVIEDDGSAPEQILAYLVERKLL